MSESYSDKALKYAEDVVAGEIDVCTYVRLACERHLSDLARQDEDDFPFVYDEASANKVCGFIALMPHTRGRWAGEGKTLKLEPWQLFFVCCVFGWLRKEDGLRRFRTAYLEVPRKNGKSPLAAAIGNYMLVADGEYGAEVFSGATTEKQAYEVFRPAWLMAKKTPAFRDAFGVELGGTEKNPGPIYSLKSASKFEPVIGKPGDGASPSCAIIDEYHEHKSDALYSTMLTGMGAREQALMLIITTAGSDTGGPCYAQRRDVVNVLEGTVEDDSLFGVIYTLDEGDDWTTEAALRKCNPNYGVSVRPEYLKDQVRKALNSPRLQNDIKTKHANIWVGAAASWMPMDKWAAGAVPDLKLEDFAGEMCWIGIDLSQRNDFTSLALLFKQLDLYYLFTRHYLPEATIQQPDHHHYQGWSHSGHLISVPGNVIDYDQVLEDLLEWNDKFRIVAAGYDKRFAHQFAIDLVAAGINAIEVPQTYAVLTEAMADLEGEVLAGRFFHDDNPVMNWHMGNTIVRTLRHGGTQGMIPGKETEEKKIDGVQAAVTAMVMEHTQKLEEESDWSEAGALVPIQ